MTCPRLAVLVLLLACAEPEGEPSDGGFERVNLCEDGQCEPCREDADCRVAVDCCGRKFFCTHVSRAVSTCKLGCSETTAPPPARCVDLQGPLGARTGRCACP